MRGAEARGASPVTCCCKVAYEVGREADALHADECDGWLPLFEEAGYRKSEIFCGAPLSTRVLPE
jgi:hypothetical protein